MVHAFATRSIAQRFRLLLGGEEHAIGLLHSFTGCTTQLAVDAKFFISGKRDLAGADQSQKFPGGVIVMNHIAYFAS